MSKHPDYQYCSTQWSGVSASEQEKIIEVTGVNSAGNIPLILNALGSERYLQSVTNGLNEAILKPLEKGNDSELPIFIEHDGNKNLTGNSILSVGLITLSEYFRQPPHREAFGMYANPGIPPEFFLPTLDILIERANLRLIATNEAVITKPPRFFRVTRE